MAEHKFAEFFRELASDPEAVHRWRGKHLAETRWSSTTELASRILAGNEFYELARRSLKVIINGVVCDAPLSLGELECIKGDQLVWAESPARAECVQATLAGSWEAQFLTRRGLVYREKESAAIACAARYNIEKVKE